jgi:hypothetical protein
VLRWSALLWVVCSVGVVVLGAAAEAAEEERNHTAHYTGPSVVALELGTAVALWLGAAAFAVGTGLVVDGLIRRAARRGAA